MKSLFLFTSTLIYYSDIVNTEDITWIVIKLFTDTIS